MFRVVRVGEEVSLGMPGPAVQVFEVRDRPREGPMARHSQTPQLLVALDHQRFGLWIAAGDSPRNWVEVGPGEAILLDPATWHYGPVPLEASHGVYLTVQAPGTDRLDHELEASGRPVGASGRPVGAFGRPVGAYGPGSRAP